MCSVFSKILVSGKLHGLASFKDLILLLPSIGKVVQYLVVLQAHGSESWSSSSWGACVEQGYGEVGKEKVPHFLLFLTP